MIKLALKLKPESRAEAHLLSEKKDWKSFERDLGSKKFRQAVLGAAEADPKLKKYVRVFGALKSSKDVVAEIKGSSGKTYQVKDLHNGRLGCTCRDWQFIHSVKGGDCKHIKALKKSGLMKKLAFIQPLIRAGAQSYRLEAKHKRLHEKGTEAKEILKATESKPSLPWHKQIFSR